MTKPRHPRDPKATKPQVELPPLHAMICESHLSTVLVSIKAGPGLACLLFGLFELAVRHPAIQDACGYKPLRRVLGIEVPETPADVSQMTGVLREFSPICCLVGEEYMSGLMRVLALPAPEAYVTWRELLPKRLAGV